ncbi:MAG: 50S ribosomal protein L13 [Candidatus Omnitrophota bacterium]
MKTFQPKEKSIEKKWHVIDAKGKILGKVAVEAAKILRGKYKVEFTPHLDCGDCVVIINAKDIVVTGKKMKQKEYKAYSGYPGGLKIRSLETMMKLDSTKVLSHAVKGMLPKNTLGRKIFGKLRVYAGERHSQSAQKPQAFDLN